MNIIIILLLLLRIIKFNKISLQYLTQIITAKLKFVVYSLNSSTNKQH